MEREFYTVKQLAEMLQLSPGRVRAEIRTGKIRAIKLGPRTQRVTRDEVRRISKNYTKNEPLLSAAV